MQILRFLFLVLLPTALFFTCFFYYYSGYFVANFLTAKSFQVEKQPLQRLTPPIILQWTTFYVALLHMPSLSSLGCPVSDCIVSTNRSLLNESDAVVFHSRDTDTQDLPWRPTQEQRWILFEWEAPPETRKIVFDVLSEHINWTVTYRQDSDIYAPYAVVRPLKTPKSLPVLPKRDRLVCWAVSHCKTASQRETYVDQLRRFIPIHVCGRCSKHNCPAGKFKCYVELAKNCKFYLSFENSICKDYVTEKLFFALKTHMVPIVMGGANYSQILPNNSYIDALNFSRPQELASYLLRLDRDEVGYMAYHAWNRDYEVLDVGFKWSCDVCKLLHSGYRGRNVNLMSWFYDDAQCRSWENKSAF